MDMVKKLTFGIGGIATLFSFAANAALPSDYIELQFIKGTGNAQAYICASDIYINPQTDKIETTFEVGSLSSGNGYAIWCARTTWQDQTCSLLWSVNNIYNKLLFQAAYSSSDGKYERRETDPAVTNTIVTVTAESNSWHVVTENGVNIQRGWPSSINASFTQTGGPLHLFAMANGTTIADGYYSAHRLYSFKIYTRSGDDYTLSHDLVPARRKSDDHVGLYDAAAGKFYANSGNGEFIAGPELSEEFSMSPLPDAVEVSSLAELLAGVVPAVVVSNLTTSTELERGKDYTVSYLNNSLIGTASVVVTGLGEYASHTSSATFKVRFAGQGDITTYYAIDGNMDGDMQSSISGTGSAIGWAAERGSATKAINGITDANGLYVVWTNNFMRTPQGSSHAAPETSVIVVEPNCTWDILNVLVAGTTLGLNNVIVREGAMVKVEQYERSNYWPAGGEVACGIDGSYDLADGACLRISTDFFNSRRWLARLLATAKVTGTGTIDMSNTWRSGDGLAAGRELTSLIRGDLSGFKGDLVACNIATNGTHSYVLELVNAVSNPGDPDPGRTAYVVVTNGATLVVDHDWVSPKNRTWILGDARRPIIRVPAGVTLTINGELIGTVGFVKEGEGTLVLTAASPSFSGDCTVFSGKVRLEGAASSLTRCFRPKSKVAVPAGYTKLDYLSLSGGGTDSYIDIGYAPASGSFGFFMDYLLKVAPASSDSKRIMGSSKVNNGLWGGLMMSTYCQNVNTQGGQFSFGALQYLTKDGGLTANERMRIKLENGVAQLSCGWSYAFGTAIDMKYFYGNIYIGNINTETITTTSAPMDVYRFKVFDGTTLLHDFVPVSNSVGAVGLYDTYGNLGFRQAANANYCTAGSDYSGSDDGWLEVVPGGGLIIFVR